jgi:superfamily II DNA or RNA helicase
VNLRPYQLKAIDDARNAVRSGKRRVLVTAPTGAGKGELLAAMSVAHEARGGQVLVATTRTVLVADLRKRLRRYGSKARVVTHQAIALAKRLPPSITMLHIDEAHHASADEFYAALQTRPDLIVIGWSATPMRENGRGLGDVFQELVQTSDVKQLQAQGFLVPCRVVAPGRLLKPGQIAQAPLAAWQANAEGRRTLAFFSRVAEAEEQAALFRAAGVAAQTIDGKMPHERRDAILSLFREGRITVLCQVGIATEGFDDPGVSCILLARGCNAALYLQICGRALRIHPGKTDAVIIDLRGVTHSHGPPDEPREFSLDKGIRRAGAGDVRFCKVCGAVLDKPGPCPDCGLESGPWQPPEVTNDPLVKWAAFRAESVDQKRVRWERWKGEALAKGHRVGSAYHRYRAVYGENPPR